MCFGTEVAPGSKDGITKKSTVRLVRMVVNNNIAQLAANFVKLSDCGGFVHHRTIRSTDFSPMAKGLESGTLPSPQHLDR